MSGKKAKSDKELEKTAAETETGLDELEIEDEDELEDDDEDEFEDGFEDDDEFETEVEYEVEHQTPEVIAKELLITYLEKNALPYPDPRRNESRYQATGRVIGEMYNALLEEIRKTAE